MLIIIMMILGLGFFGLSFYGNGKAHQHNDGTGGGQIMVGAFMMILAILWIVSLFIY